MATGQPAIVLTPADIDTLESERALPVALGLGAVSQLSFNSLYATRHIKAVPHNGLAG